MNVWLWAAAGMMLATIPCGIRMLTGSTMNRLLGMQMAGLAVLLALLLLAEGFGRSIYFDVPLTLAVLSYAGGQTYARMLERWL